jgi:hypothetical protein
MLGAAKQRPVFAKYEPLAVTAILVGGRRICSIKIRVF